MNEVNSPDGNNSNFDKEKWIRLVGSVAEVFGYVVFQLSVAGLMLYEVISYILSKLK